MDEIIVFDWGGVLVRGFSDLYISLAKDINSSPYSIRNYLVSKPYMRGDITHREWITGFRDKFFPDSNVDEFDKLILGKYLKKYVRLDEEVFAIVNRIKEERCTLAALSNTSEMFVRFALDNFPEFYSSFRRLYLSYEMRCLKPESEIYLRMINDLSMSPNQITFIDDNEENIKAANKLGIKGILYKDSKQLEKELFK